MPRKALFATLVLLAFMAPTFAQQRLSLAMDKLSKMTVEDLEVALWAEPIASLPRL